jgi:hypothetical protein
LRCAPPLTVVDLPRPVRDGGRSAPVASAWRVGGSTTVSAWTETVADVPTSPAAGQHAAVDGWLHGAAKGGPAQLGTFGVPRPVFDVPAVRLGYRVEEGPGMRRARSCNRAGESLFEECSFGRVGGTAQRLRVGLPRVVDPAEAAQQFHIAWLAVAVYVALVASDGPVALTARRLEPAPAA